MVEPETTDPVYPDFLGTVQPDPVCGTEAHPAGDCNYQALPSADGKRSVGTQ